MNVTTQSVDDFVASLEDLQKRVDSTRLIEIMHRETGLAPAMWGTNMIGFGSYHYAYDSGREGDMFLVGFAPRKPAFVLYNILASDPDLELAQKLGKYTTGKGCLYIKKLADIDEAVLGYMIAQAYRLKTQAS